MQFAVGNAFDEGEKCRVLCLEPVVEPAGDTLNIECRPDATGNIRQSESGLLLFQRHGKKLQLLEQWISALAGMVILRAAGDRPAGFTSHPQP